MRDEEFLAGLTGSDSDLRLAVEALREAGQLFCIIGGLAVNHYVEPVVTLDADFAVVAATGVNEALQARGFRVEAVANSIKAQLPGSRLRLQITINSPYGTFPARAVPGRLFGLDMPIASLPDLVQGKLWALQDSARRLSKRAKDRANLIRLCESHRQVFDLIPPGLIAAVDEMRTSR